jgi:ribosome-associated protein
MIGPDTEKDAPPEWRGPSRSQQKRDARAIFDVGVLLTKLAPSELKRLPLDEAQLEAVLLARSMKRTALARQWRRIAKLLRDGDCDPLMAALRDNRRLP